MRRPSTVVRRRVEADGGPLGESAVPVSKKCSQRLIAGIRKRARLLPSNHKIQLAVIVKVTHAYNDGKLDFVVAGQQPGSLDRKSTRLNSSHLGISYAVFCL